MYPRSRYENGDIKGKLYRELDDVTEKIRGGSVCTQNFMGRFRTYQKVYGVVPYVPKRVRGNTICDWKGRGAVPPVPVITKRSYDHTREVLRPVYYLTIVLG